MLVSRGSCYRRPSSVSRSADDSYGCSSCEVDLERAVLPGRDGDGRWRCGTAAGARARRVDSSGVSYKLRPDAAAVPARLMVLLQRLIMTGVCVCVCVCVCVRRPCNPHR